MLDVKMLCVGVCVCVCESACFVSAGVLKLRWKVNAGAVML